MYEFIIFPEHSALPYMMFSLHTLILLIVILHGIMVIVGNELWLPIYKSLNETA